MVWAGQALRHYPSVPTKEPEPGHQRGVWLSPAFSGAAFTAASINLLFQGGLPTPEPQECQLWGPTYPSIFSNRYIGIYFPIDTIEILGGSLTI